MAARWNRIACAVSALMVIGQTITSAEVARSTHPPPATQLLRSFKLSAESGTFQARWRISQVYDQRIHGKLASVRRRESIRGQYQIAVPVRVEEWATLPSGISLDTVQIGLRIAALAHGLPRTYGVANGR